MPAAPDVPLRPMTLGELLDAAVSLLRHRALPLLTVGAVLAATEQVALAPLRATAGVTAPFYGPSEANLSGWWEVLAVGFATEAVIITLLGALAAAAAGPALVGRPIRHRDLWPRIPGSAVLTVTAILTLAAGLSAYLGLLPWLFVYGLFGLAAPALVIDQVGGPFAALGRSVRLSVRSGMRAAWIRLSGYLAWFAVRFALGTGWTAVVAQVTGDRPEWQQWLVPVCWAIGNTVAYAALACLDAVLLLETRIRTEGLDITINRARSRGEDDTAPLVLSP